jgi:ABC-type branched-subunit amino acid transport system ATPase component
VQQLSHERDVAVVLVEQHADRALRHADRACILRRGQIALADDCRSLLQRRSEVESLYF